MFDKEGLYESELILDAARNDLLSYMMLMHSNCRATRFTEALTYEVQRALEGKLDRLMITASPRHGKSYVVSENAPGWFLGKQPKKKIILASHTDGLAVDFGTIVKRNMSNPMHGSVFGEEAMVSRTKAANHNFRTNAGGEFMALGVGGSPIGKGADCFIIDDPIRNREDVESEGTRRFYRSWYSSSVLSRLEGQGLVILMHQRFHDDDLAGQLLKEEGDRWRVIQFPALIETEEDQMIDYLRRSIGEPLVPELHSREKLLDLKSSMLLRDWKSLYQCSPVGSIGEEFVPSMMQHYQQRPDAIRAGMNVYIIVDPATSNDKYSDNTAMVVVGLGEDGNYYILDLVAERLDLMGRTEKLFELHRRWRPICTYYESYGLASDIQHIEYIMGQENYRFPIVKVGGSAKNRKVDSIRRLTPDMLQARWWAPNADDFIRIDSDGKTYHPIKVLFDEMVPFPYGKHDDCLDALSRIYDIPVLWPNSNGPRRSSSGPKISPW
jgi:hypothetical protein